MKNAFHSLEGKILVASPNIGDSFFEKSLIYIFLHDKNGALGVVLNHKIGAVPAQELTKLSNKKQLKGQDEHCYNLPIILGGPVNTDRIIAFSVTASQEQGFGNYQSLTLHTDIDNFVKEYLNNGKSTKFLLAKGISAWGSSQLEGEIASNSWFVIPPQLNLIFSQDIHNKWENVIKELGIQDFRFVSPYQGNA